jgi:hypothetical protein
MGFFLLIKNYFMIYKFEENSMNLEVELFNEENQSQNLPDNILFSIKDIDDKNDSWHSVSLNKKDVYLLIGALHLLHKEMK